MTASGVVPGHTCQLDKLTGAPWASLHKFYRSTKGKRLATDGSTRKLVADGNARKLAAAYVRFVNPAPIACTLHNPQALLSAMQDHDLLYTHLLQNVQNELRCGCSF